MKSGKRFENNFKGSVPKEVFYYRFKDGSASWGGNESVRFQSSNICDCMIYANGSLCLLELKSHKGKSLPFSAVRDNQLEELMGAYDKGVLAGLLVEFSDVKRVFWLDISIYNDYTKDSDRKSVPIDYFEEYGYELNVETKVVNITMNIKKFIDDIF